MIMMVLSIMIMILVIVMRMVTRIKSRECPEAVLFIIGGGGRGVTYDKDDSEDDVDEEDGNDDEAAEKVGNAREQYCL